MKMTDREVVRMREIVLLFCIVSSLAIRSRAESYWRSNANIAKEGIDVSYRFVYDLSDGAIAAGVRSSLTEQIYCSDNAIKAAKNFRATEMAITNLFTVSANATYDYRYYLTAEFAVNIAKDGFAGLSQITSVSVINEASPSSISDTFIRAYFDGMYGFKNYPLGGNSHYQKRVADIDWLPVLTNIGESAFADCISVTNLFLDAGVVSLESRAFSGCIELRSIVLGEDIARLGEDAFGGDEQIEDVCFKGAPPAGLVRSHLFDNYPKLVYPGEFDGEWQSALAECSTGLCVKVNNATNEFVSVGSSKTIMMSCDVAEANIYYTIDGSDPTTNSARYASKFKVKPDGKMTIKASAIIDRWPYHSVQSITLAPGKCEMPSASMEDGSKFYFRNQNVTLTANTDGCVIRYTLDGTEPTEASTVYESPIVISETTTIKAKAFRDDYFESDVMSVTLVRDRYQVATPCVVAYYGEIAAGNERTTFEGSHVKVVMTNATEGSEIHYTLDGSIPTSDSPIYDATFKVFTDMTIRAVAIKDDWQDSPVGELKLVKETGIGDVMKDADMAFVNDASYPWTVDSLVFYSGTSSMRSGGTGDNGASTLLTSVTGAGRVLFRWKAACESDVYDHEFDHGEFRVDGTEAANRIDGESEWRAEDVRIDGEGPHTLAWVYQKDDCDEKGYSGGNIWVDNFVWIPDDGSKVTYRSETEVPYNWLYRYGLLKESVPEVAVIRVTGKRDADGRMLTTEADYVAGTDPTNAMSQLKAFVDLSEGYPKVTWDPDLNEDGTKAIRTYKVWGKEALDDGAGWVWPTNALHRIFKVTVEMP